MKTELKVYITPEAHAQIMYYVHKSDVEISGLGRIIKRDGKMIVHKVYLLDQENGPASTDIDENAMSKLLFETRMDEGDLNFWWHSHVNMGVFWSGTDMDTIKQFGRKGYILATVFNKKGEHRTAYLQGQGDFLPEIFIDNIETGFQYLPTKEMTDEWEKEFTSKCKKTPVYSPGIVSHGNRGWSGYGHDHYSGGYEDDSYYYGRSRVVGIGAKEPVDIPPVTAVTAEEYMGVNTSMSQTELCRAVKRFWAKNPTPSYESLTTQEWLTLADIAELSEDDSPTEEDIKDAYNFICASRVNADWICERIMGYGDRLEAAEKQEAEQLEFEQFMDDKFDDEDKKSIFQLQLEAARKIAEEV